MKGQIKFRIFLSLVLLFGFLFFIYKSIIPGGKIVYSTNFRKNDYFIKKFGPETRISDYGEHERNVLIGEPVYYNIYTPRNFTKLLLHYEYKNPAQIPLLETGILVDGKLWRHRLVPVENRLLDRLSLVWDTYSEGDKMLLIRPGIDYEFGGISNFLSEAPDYRKIAVYNFNFENDFILEDYEANFENSGVIPALRGAYQFYAYLKNEDLRLVFTFGDLNLNRDPDPILINLYLNDDLIDYRKLEDDGIVDDKGEQTEFRELEFALKNLPEGAYKVEINAGSDIVTKSIETELSKIAFVNKFELHKEGKGDIAVFSDSRELQFTTTYPDSLQNLKINGENFGLAQTYTQHRTEIDSKATGSEIILERDGLIVSGNGVFGFWPDALFNPRLKRADYNLDVNRDGIDYIIAGYRIPEKRGDWSVLEIEFDLEEAYRERKQYGFIISAPGLDSNPGIVFNSIKAEFEGKSLFEKINNLYSRNKKL